MRSIPAGRLFGFVLAIALAAGIGPRASAHRIDVAATIDHDGVHVSVSDSHGTAIADATIEVTDPDGNELTRGETDADGRFVFKLATIPEHVNIVATTADGHKASLTFGRDRFSALENDGESENAQTQDHEHGDEQSEAEESVESDSHVNGIESELDEIEELHGILAKQQAELDDIQAQLLQLTRPKTGVSRESVVAGIGFIFGVTGFIAACFALRRVAGKEY